MYKKHLPNPNLKTEKAEIIVNGIEVFTISFDKLEEIDWIDADAVPKIKFISFLENLDKKIHTTWEDDCLIFDILDQGLSFYNNFYESGEDDI